MSANSKVVEDKPLSDEGKIKAFVKDYESLCDKHQMRIVTTPAFKIRDDNTFSVVLQTSIGKLPKND